MINKGIEHLNNTVKQIDKFKNHQLDFKRKQRRLKF